MRDITVTQTLGVKVYCPDEVPPIVLKNYLIVSMASDLDALLVISWLSLLTFGHPFWGFRWNFRCCLRHIKRYQKLLIVWYIALMSKLPSFGFYPSLCSFISNLLPDRCIAAVVDGHCSSPKPINSGVHRFLAYHPLFSYYSSMTFSILLSVLSTHILMNLSCSPRLQSDTQASNR